MAGRLSFSIAINLLTENFRKGSNQVKAAFRSMQMQILTFAAALGAGGIGLSNLVSRFIDIARETNRVTTALKNVSGSMSQYADNQRYLLELAKKYGLEINALTANYAKFTAAASISGMSMMDQRKVFESVSRACTAFGMSADDSNGVMLALSQMMSKGKISSEELRLQMGERLPVALQAMAKAAGVSVGGLDKLMKQGQLMSKDVLPKFAEALKEMIPNVDTNNLETSVNHLKNAFTEFVNGTGIQSKYKALIDWLTGAIQGLGENIKNIVIGIVAVISGVVANGAMKLWVSINSTAKQLEATALRSNASLIAATNNRIAAEIALEKAKVAANNATGAAAIAARQRVTQAQNALVAASAAEQIAIENVKEAELKILDAKKIANAKSTAGALAVITRKRVAAEIELEEAKLGVITANSAQIIAAQQRLAIAQTNLAKITAKEVSAQEAAKAAAAQAASVKSATWWNTACLRMKAAGAKLVVSLKSMWSSFAPMIIVSAIIAIIGKFKAMHDEAQRIKKIFSEYKKESERITHTPEIIQLKVIQDLYNKAADGSKLKEKYQNRIIELLGGELKKNQDINDAVRERIKLLEATAKTDYFTRKKIEAEDKLKGIYDKRGGEKAFNFQYQNAKENEGVVNFGGQAPIIQEMEEAIGLRKIIADADANIREYTEFLEKNKTTIPPITDPDDKKKKTPLQKAEEDYHNSLKNYKNQLDAGAITQDKYNEEIDKLNSDTVVKLGGILGKSADANETYAAALLGMLNPRVTESAKIQAELSKVEDKYKKATELAKSKLDKKLISEDEYRHALIEAATAAANSAISIENIGDAADGFIKKMRGIVGENLKIETPKLGKRDTTFDYKKTDVDKKSEELDIWIKYKDDLKEKLEEAKKAGSDTAKSLEIELNRAIANVPSLEEALKLAQVQEDIKNLNKELNESLYSGVKDIASSSDRIVSAFSNLRDVMNDVDASGWERIMAVWNAMTNVVDAFLSIIKMIENITELTNKLTKAKEQETEKTITNTGSNIAETAVDTITTNVKVANSDKRIKADIKEASTAATTATTEVAANTAKGVSAAGSSAASLPFPANIIAIGVAIAAAVALFASIPKFAKGGIISGGPASGDKILARVNAGEMILNQGQQSRLFEAINSGKLGGSGNMSSTVTTKVRAKDLILTINNELKSQGKKPIS